MLKTVVVVMVEVEDEEENEEEDEGVSYMSTEGNKLVMVLWGCGFSLSLLC